MKRPKSLILLLEELDTFSSPSPVKAEPGSYVMVVYSDGERFRLNFEECLSIFRNEETVGKLIEVLDGDVTDISLEIHGIVMPESVSEFLENEFSNIDEV